jgi:hypothetical protein
MTSQKIYALIYQTTFYDRIQEQQLLLHQLRSRRQLLLHQLRSERQLLRQCISNHHQTLKAMEPLKLSMEALARKSYSDALQCRVITLITLLYLPGNFCAQLIKPITVEGLSNVLPIIVEGSVQNAIADRGSVANLMTADLAMTLGIEFKHDSTCPILRLPISTRTIKAIGRVKVACQFPGEPDTMKAHDFIIC